eukprot:4858295-Karenia_brevis.AAC.1
MQGGRPAKRRTMYSKGLTIWSKHLKRSNAPPYKWRGGDGSKLGIKSCQIPRVLRSKALDASENLWKSPCLGP